jgi:unsaturated rhamnogalacturonyl hydrolase
MKESSPCSDLHLTKGFEMHTTCAVCCLIAAALLLTIPSASQDVNGSLIPDPGKAFNQQPSTESLGADKSDLSHWPAGSSPVEIGERVARRLLQRPLAFSGHGEPARHITYPEVCTWYGALVFSRLAADTALQAALVRRFDPLLSDRRDLLPEPNHVDLTVFAAIPLEIFIQNQDRCCLELGKHMADKQWEEPDGSAVNEEARNYFKRGFTPQTRLWIDDMFMITAAQAQAYRATGDQRYIDRAAKEMVMYLDSLQKPNGLFFHAPDVPFYWGRGNGWMAAGMCELLRSLPQDHPAHLRIMDGYRAMMASLLKYQDSNGMWHQLIESPDSWPETSSSGMFAFAFITGVKNGWLDKEIYAPAARKAWLALVGYINDDGDIREVCEGTGKKNDRQYYLDRRRNIGDLHGQAPVLWSASALLR